MMQCAQIMYYYVHFQFYSNSSTIYLQLAPTNQPFLYNNKSTSVCLRNENLTLSLSPTQSSNLFVFSIPLVFSNMHEQSVCELNATRHGHCTMDDDTGGMVGVLVCECDTHLIHRGGGVIIRALSLL